MSAKILWRSLARLPAPSWESAARWAQFLFMAPVALLIIARIAWNAHTVFANSVWAYALSWLTIVESTRAVSLVYDDDHSSGLVADIMRNVGSPVRAMGGYFLGAFAVAARLMLRWLPVTMALDINMLSASTKLSDSWSLWAFWGDQWRLAILAVGVNLLWKLGFRQSIGALVGLLAWVVSAFSVSAMLSSPGPMPIMQRLIFSSDPRRLLEMAPFLLLVVGLLGCLLIIGKFSPWFRDRGAMRCTGGIRLGEIHSMGPIETWATIIRARVSVRSFGWRFAFVGLMIWGSISPFGNDYAFVSALVVLFWWGGLMATWNVRLVLRLCKDRRERSFEALLGPGMGGEEFFDGIIAAWLDFSRPMRRLALVGAGLAWAQDIVQLAGTDLALVNVCLMWLIVIGVLLLPAYPQGGVWIAMNTASVGLSVWSGMGASGLATMIPVWIYAIPSLVGYFDAFPMGTRGESIVLVAALLMGTVGGLGFQRLGGNGMGERWERGEGTVLGKLVAPLNMPRSQAEAAIRKHFFAVVTAPLPSKAATKKWGLNSVEPLEPDRDLRLKRLWEPPTAQRPSNIFE